MMKTITTIMMTKMKIPTKINDISGSPSHFSCRRGLWCRPIVYFHYLKQQRTCLRIIIWQSGDLPLLISEHSCARFKIRSYRISNYLMQHTQPTGNLYFDALCAQKYLNNKHLRRVPGFIYWFTTFSRPWVTLKGATRHAHVFPDDLRTYATTVWPIAIKFGIRHVRDGRVYYTVK